ncbi:hypothetical protein ATANTOWER_019421 [Ataeniobius toweri]|uniref:Uncharacterized protein n=1 Tax=Ataeniobius toweri TaxID=208326 RepID=A0ABU7CHM1_9TELE|nr:hypothetical protein [Ataeniobius toweri]
MTQLGGKRVADSLSISTGENCRERASGLMFLEPGRKEMERLNREKNRNQWDATLQVASHWSKEDYFVTVRVARSHIIQAKLVILFQYVERGEQKSIMHCVVFLLLDCNFISNTH